MLRLRNITIAAILLCACTQDVVGSCNDEQDWCELQKAFCDTTEPQLRKDMRKWCRKTCNNCLPKECKECEQNCTVLANGQHECLCNDGYKLKNDERSCTDINECDTPVKPCKPDEVCRNYDGGYECLKDKCIPFYDRNFIRSYSFPDKCCKMTNGECGVNTQNEASGRIINGTDAEGGMWPWHVFIILPNDLCGGSLLNSLWVVSAAHCFERVRNVKEAKINVWFGVTDSNKLGLPSHQKRKVKQIIRHEKYEFPKNDIALVKLNNPVKESIFIRPVCLPNGEKPAVGTRCFTTGFGVTEVGSGRPSDTLKQVDVPIVDEDTCKRAYEDVRDIDPERMICAGYKEGGRDACQGDSGGPLVCQKCNSCDWYLVGVTSFGEGCATPEFYGVYTNVEYYEKWIESKTCELKVEKKQCKPTRWSKWGDWTKCLVSCNGGTQTRIRICINGQAGLPGCLGEEFERKECNTQACGVDSWTEWTLCSKTCGKGEQSREVVCAAAGCRKRTQRKECNTQRCPTWRNWTSWGQCTDTCGGGDQIRTRSCVAGTMGQPGCQGADRQAQTCNEDVPCPEWEPWSDWTKCGVTCGGGQQTSTRKCKNGLTGIDCKGDRRRTRSCSEDACQGVFRPWSRWSKCTKTCGRGTQERTRSCPASSCAPDEFGSETTDTKACATNKCVGRWTAWSPWDVCSKTCGSGTRTRIRTCHGGGECVGKDTDEGACMTNECIGTWSSWSVWSNCDTTCGSGVQERSRTCKNGVNCRGRSKITKGCSLRTCPIWSSWSDWSACSKTCEGGEKTRTRTCGEEAQDKGLCPGKSDDTEQCEEGPCKASCHDDCRPYVAYGYCVTPSLRMPDFCDSDCCENQYCKDTNIDDCEYYGASPCSNPEYADICLNTCGLCP